MQGGDEAEGWGSRGRKGVEKEGGDCFLSCSGSRSLGDGPYLSGMTLEVYLLWAPISEARTSDRSWRHKGNNQPLFIPPLSPFSWETYRAQL